MGTGPLPGGKAAGAWNWPLPLAPKLKKEWSYTSIPLLALMVCSSVAFIFTLNKKRERILVFSSMDLGIRHFFVNVVCFWVIPRRLNFICRHFGTLSVFHLHRQVGMKVTYLPVKMERTECSETSEYKIQTPGNYPEKSIQHSERGESLKPRIFCYIFLLCS